MALKELLQCGALAVIRTQDQKYGEEVSAAIVDAGITCIEVTLTTPGALEIIAKLASNKGICVGVGTLIDLADIARAKDAGAQYILSPHTDARLIRASKDAGLISIPGVATASDVATALAAGADILKLFPASTYGTSHLKALADPFPGNFWCPTGGISLASIPEWFSAGASLVGLGGPLLHGGIKEIANNVKAYMASIREAQEGVQ